MTGLAGGIASWPFVAEAAARELSSACCYHALEHVGMLPVVVPEGELVEVQREVVLRHFMEGAHDAALDERPEAIQIIGMDVTVDVFADGVAHDLVRETCFQHAIAWVFICGDQIHLLRDCLVNKPRQGELVGILDYLRDDISLAGDCTDHGEFPRRSTASCSLLMATSNPPSMSVLGLPTDVGFVHFDYARQLLELPVLHSGADTVTHVPRRPIGTRADGTLNLHGAHPLLALAHEIDHLEPGAERVVSVLEDGPHQWREAVALLATLLALPVPWTGEFMNFRVPTAWAGDTLRPAQLNQVALAGVLGGEPCI